MSWHLAGDRTWTYPTTVDLVEQAWAGDPTLARPRPDTAALRTPRPELRSIVTHPPILGGGGSGSASMTAV